MGEGVCKENKIDQTPKTVGCNVMQNVVGFHVVFECTSPVCKLTGLGKEE